MGDVGGDSTKDLIKKLVRYALACEHSRTPIRREGIREKGMFGTAYLREGPHHVLTRLRRPQCSAHRAGSSRRSSTEHRKRCVPCSVWR